jgi:hypothetical protein
VRAVHGADQSHDNDGAARFVRSTRSARSARLPTRSLARSRSWLYCAQGDDYARRLPDLHSRLRTAVVARVCRPERNVRAGRVEALSTRIVQNVEWLQGWLDEQAARDRQRTADAAEDDDEDEDGSDVGDGDEVEDDGDVDEGEHDDGVEDVEGDEGALGHDSAGASAAAGGSDAVAKRTRQGVAIGGKAAKRSSQAKSGAKRVFTEKRTTRDRANVKARKIQDPRVKKDDEQGEEKVSQVNADASRCVRKDFSLACAKILDLLQHTHTHTHTHTPLAGQGSQKALAPHEAKGSRSTPPRAVQHWP